ncbi:dicer-like protein 1 [Dendryphion nanum]|uniref:Dicer-like protein 1 n=1 Tax=Dendryphion nanum TaxID=256645 RepID=A0A9P9DC08_9PLEO|nr:dicer-like protein 1 [Dendryphion nanum]
MASWAADLDEEQWDEPNYTDSEPEEEVQNASGDDNMDGNRDDEQNTSNSDLSIRDILAKQETSAKIINPRDYQIELYERAKEENTIAVLATGSGKTHIATLLLRHILDLELEARSKREAPKTAFFLVDSVNLVFQQANVLQCGLDQNVEGVCGAMGASLWTKSTWDQYLSRNMVIVCTAEVLIQALMHSFIKIAGINLLIFDEAHHTKNNHPYARILREYYITEKDLSKRPRIFGMTASPVDANVDVRQAAKDLETLLHSRIATVSDLKLLQNDITLPEEEVAVYDRLIPAFETPFHQELKMRFGNIEPLQRLFKDSVLLSSELGRWASDVYWSFALSEIEGRKVERRQELRHHRVDTNIRKISDLDKQIAQIREASEYVQGHDFGVPSPTAADLSEKVLLLRHWLGRYYVRTGDALCIVFVERRATARLLNLIFSHIGGPFLHTDILVGNNSRIGDQKVSLRTQIMTLAKFRRGELNCLFATSVAEEGLDIPQCNLVVRFDLYRTMIGYVQSRGRARHRNAKYLHMVESGNFDHRSQVVMAKKSEKTLKEFCRDLPNDRLIDKDDGDIADLFEHHESYPAYVDPESGARLTYRSSLSVVAHFTASLPAPNQEAILVPNYIVEGIEEKYIAEVVLPGYSPITSMRGRPHRRKMIAKCSAAFELCLELRRKGYLDENLLPTYKKQLPAMRNAHLAVSEKSKNQYVMRIKPDFWDIGFDSIPEKLYLTVVDVAPGLNRPHQPIGLITRAPLPQMPEFPIFLNNGRASQVVSKSLAIAFAATDKNLEQFTTVSLQVYSHIFAKKYEYDVAKMSYWILPLLTGNASDPQILSPEDLIDWEQIRMICENSEYPWTPAMSNNFLADRYFVDKWDGGRRFYSIMARPDMSIHGPVPRSSPRHKFMDDILDYSVSLWAKSRVTKVWDQSQPVVEVEKIPFRRNLLADVEKDEDEVKSNLRTFVCPEPMLISTLSTRFVAMCYVFPAIIHRFEAYLVALDACDKLGLNISPKLALEAVTKDSENADESGAEIINFKSGMGPNYERLEFMGDCFLKMATSMSTFVQQPDENEFQFHVRRMLMLCNANLFQSAKNYKLFEYVRSMAFSRRTWYPRGLKLTWGKGHKQTGPQVIKHALGDKSVADVCEALIGAAFMQDNDINNWKPANWDQAVRAVKLLVSSEDHLMEKFSDYYASYQMPKYQFGEATASQFDLAAKVEKKHPYHFRYPRLLRSAFIHPSQAFMWENIPNYQRLEFLGDSLLDMAFIMHLFYQYPDKDPHWLTQHKEPMVANKFLACVCVDLGFHSYLRHNHPVLGTQIREYVQELQEAEREARGKADYWAYWENVTQEPPKCLADVVEAFTAALFVDSEFNFAVVQNFFDLHLKKFFTDMYIYDPYINNNPMNRLQKLFEINFGCKHWKLAGLAQDAMVPGQKQSVVAMLQIHYKVHFHCIRESNRYAKPHVIKMALGALEGLPPFEFRKRFGCDCTDDDAEMENLINDTSQMKIVANGDEDMAMKDAPMTP